MNSKMFTALLESVQEMDVIAKGKSKPARAFRYPDPEVKAIREHTGLSQSRFARLIGVSTYTLENWEQGRRRPTGPARALLKIVESDPEGTIRALQG
ncbi:MAG: helix-turn-helix domain-containing protein [Gammaproteobacteria bacterium]